MPLQFYKGLPTLKKFTLDIPERGLGGLGATLGDHLKREMANDWPAGSGVCCWWCCSSFSTVPIPLPIDYDERRNVFSVMGTFCSFGCAKAYNMSRLSVNKDRCCTLLSFMRCKIASKNGRHILTTTSSITYGIKVAPNRYSLKMFGGSMTVEQFRAGLEVLLKPEDANDVKFVVRPPERESKVIYDPRLGMGNKEKAFLEGHSGWDEDTTVAFEGLGEEPVKKIRKRKAEQKPPIKKQEQNILNSIREGTTIRNQPYKLQRALPLPREGNNLFSAMNIEIEPVKDSHQEDLFTKASTT
jgi:hypothetical protein